MISNEELLTQLMDKVSGRIVSDLRDSIAHTVEQEISRNLSRMLLEGEFYRRINDDMQQGLKHIYQEISLVRKDDEAGGEITGAETGELLHEASDQLDKILQTTEQATVEIMEIVEKHMDLQAEVGDILGGLEPGTIDQERAARLKSANDELNADLMRIMTTLGFQDLTGQRIKRIIDALKRVEKITFELFLSTGLKIKAKESDPDKDFNQVEAEATQKMSELKGPQVGVSQSDIDDLLKQLGME